ncbi:hypothetical protein LCGC14_3059170, partial [marine sediment metagenome]
AMEYFNSFFESGATPESMIAIDSWGDPEYTSALGRGDCAILFLPPSAFQAAQDQSEAPLASAADPRGSETRISHLGGRTLVINPATEHPIATVPKGGREDARNAIAAAREAFDSGVWSGLDGEERKRILLSHIHGVDIDSQAVETTKLSLLLKVLEGESAQTIGSNLRLFHERALPDLAANIKCGNSLIGPDFYDNQQMAMFDEEERYRINVFDWNAEFKDIMQAGGFDAVIGNPPYGALFTEQEKNYLSSKYVAQTYQLDSYQLFLERAVAYLLSEAGFYGMIIPNPWLTNLVQTAIRRMVTAETRIVDVVHFRFAVFPKVTVDTQIVVLQKADPVHWRASVSILDSSMALG